MDTVHTIDIDKYRYSLPDSYVAKYPLDSRDQSKLLHYHGSRIKQRTFSELPEILPKNSWLVYNNTKVIQARLHFTKKTGARIEIFCLEPIFPSGFEQSFQSIQSCSWKCLVGNAKKWKEGPISLATTIDGSDIVMEALLIEQSKEYFVIRFQWGNPKFTFAELIENAGSTPIPPYLKRDAEKSDRERYQTIYSRDLGSVAAPTAGLHFTEQLIQRLTEAGICTEEITLHVGAGTFVPVKESNARNHSMHAEQVVISRSFLEKWLCQTGDLIAVGTTSTRSLESIYWLGVKLLLGEKLDPDQLVLRQWENENLSGVASLKESLEALIDFSVRYNLEQLQFSTQLMIVPGYSFRTISGLITNFHLPGSTLLLLIAAFIGDDWVKIYDYAVKHRFRFLSYGDSSVLLP